MLVGISPNAIFDSVGNSNDDYLQAAFRPALVAIMVVNARMPPQFLMVCIRAFKSA